MIKVVKVYRKIGEKDWNIYSPKGLSKKELEEISKTFHEEARRMM